uniref:EF-hand calcium binding domain 2 n=1 Tax=Bos taurus TaxID=9913 RepID=A0AAA9RWK9_BOVIN
SLGAGGEHWTGENVGRRWGRWEGEAAALRVASVTPPESSSPPALQLRFKICSKKREVGTIIRSLGCCPSEGELHDLIAEVEEEEPTGYIRFEKFLPVMTEVLLERRYRPIPEDILLRAFEVLDPAKRGFLSKDELIKYMTEEGEPFSQEEMEEMLSAAIDPESNSIHYKDYITMMVIDEN